MISNITIANEASYSADGVTIQPKPISYIFGTNGTGKTTISRVIDSKETLEGCTVTWCDDQPLDVFVYNRDFVEDTFASQMDGVFALGAAEKSTVEELQTKNAERSRIQEELTGLKSTLSEKHEERRKKFEQFKEVCWKQKAAFEGDFRPALQGSMNSKASFCDKVLSEESTINATLLSLEELKTKAQTLFAENAAKVEPIAIPDFSSLSQILSNPIWGKVVVGSSDIGISALIEKLENSDWVGQGRKYLDHSEEACPFCQQGLPHDFKDQLEQYFGGEFAEDTKLIKKLMDQHTEQCQAILAPLENLSDKQKSFFEGDYEHSVGALRQKFEDNYRLLNQKAENPSQEIKPNDVRDFCDEFLKKLSNTNQKILEHNTRIDNLASEQRTLIREVWKLILEELKASLATYKKEDSDLDKAIANLNTQVEPKQKKLGELNKRITELERDTVSVQPTVDAINKTLNDYGFSGFRLVVDKDQEDKYRLLRNGVIEDEIQKTLSEG